MIEMLIIGDSLMGRKVNKVSKGKGRSKRHVGSFKNSWMASVHLKELAFRQVEAEAWRAFRPAL